MEMITPDEIEGILMRQMKGADIHVEDMTGTNDHFEVRVVWEGFQGKGLIDQHKMVNLALAEPLQDGRIHALKIKTKIPSSS